MLFEFENDRLKKEAAVRVPLRAITAAILEVDSKYSTFLDSGDRDKRIELVRDGIEEICVRQAAINDLPAEQVIPAVLEHLASDSGDSIYEGIENSTVTAPKKVDLFEPIGGGDRTKWEEVPTNADGQREKFENLDVKETQKLLQGDTAPGKKSKIEHQDFEYGGFVDEAGKPGSLVGTRHDAEEFDPNDQGKHKDKYEMVGGEAGGQTNPESHKNIDKDNSDAKEVNPR